PRQSGDVHPPHVVMLDEQVQRVLVLVEAVALANDLLQPADQLGAGLGAAPEEADALAHLLPRLRNDFLAERDDPIAPRVVLDLFAGVLKAPVDEERARGRAVDEAAQELAGE